MTRRYNAWTGPLRHVVPVGLPSAAGNTTTTPLASGQTFTGEFEQVDTPDVLVSVKTNVASTLYFDFSNDGTNVDTFPSAGFVVAAGTHTIHKAVKAGRYFRIRIVNGGSDQQYLRAYTYFGSFSPLNSPIGNQVGTDADATLVKAVLSGVGSLNVVVSDHGALYVTPPPEGKTAFGELAVAEPYPVAQLTFAYGINQSIVETRQNQSGTVTQSARQAVIATGAAASSSGELRSRRILKYNPGQGAMARFTAVFTTGVANSTQIIGLGNESDGLFFGFNGTSFGILHRRNGAPEIRTLTVSTKSSTNENITITLDGTAKTVAVTNGADATVTANEIAAADYSNTGTGWTAYAVGNTVVFKSWDAAVHNGTFSLSGASTAVGAFAQNVTGTAPTEDWTPQASWNGADKFDGTGITGVTLDPTKGNVFQIKYQWLGYGVLQAFIEDPDDGELHLVHTVIYANANTSPSFGDPSLCLMAKATNTSNTSNITLKTPSMGAFIEGDVQQLGVRFGVRSNKTDVTTALRPLLSIRQGLHTNSVAVQTFSRILRLAAACEHSKPVTVVMLRDAVLVGASWSDALTGRSSVQVDTSATSLTGGREQFSMTLGKTGQDNIDFVEDYFANALAPGQTMTVAAITSSGINAEVSASLKVLERI